MSSTEVILLFIAFIAFAVAAVPAYIPGKTWWGTLGAGGLAAWVLIQLVNHVD